MVFIKCLPQKSLSAKTQYKTITMYTNIRPKKRWEFDDVTVKPSFAPKIEGATH